MSEHERQEVAGREMGMLKERPPRDGSLIATPLGRLTGLLLRFPRHVLVVSLLSAAGALALAACMLGFHTNRLDLLNPRSGYNQRWLAYLDEFGQEDDAVIVVESSDHDAVVTAVDRIAESLEEHPAFFHSVLARIDVAPLRAKALHFLSPQELNRVAQALDQLAPVLAGHWADLELSTLLHDWNQQLAGIANGASSPADSDQVGRSTALAVAILNGLSTEFDATASQPIRVIPAFVDGADHPLGQLIGQGDGHIVFDGGRLGLVLVRLAKPTDTKFVRGGRAISQLRQILDEYRSAHPEVKIGLTGLPILENDEMQTSQADMAVAGAVSLVGVACLFIAGFGGIRLPLLTVAALLIGMAWSFGYATLSVGHLNILSIAFGVILIGLGIDFGIHYVARYAQLRSSGMDREKALTETASGVGPGVMIGGITTALAFLSAALTDFTGVAELGIIAGGGIVLCVVASLFVLPVLIRLFEPHTSRWRAPRPLPFATLCAPVRWVPRLVLGVAVIVTVVMGAGTWHLTFDHNLLHLQADGLDSVVWEHRLLKSDNHSVWFAVSMAQSPEQLHQKRAAFAKLASVQRVEEIVSLVPAGSAEQTRLISSISRRLASMPEAVPLLPVAPRNVLLEELQSLQDTIARQPGRLSQLGQLAQGLVRQLQDRPWPDRARQISRYQQRLAGQILGQLRLLRAAAEPETPGTDDLPTALVDRFVGRRGQHLLRVYARGNIWDMEGLASFVRDVESVDPRITGHPIQTYYASLQMQRSYVHAAIYSLLAVAIILMLDLRSVRMVLLAMAPMGCGMIQMLGLLGWLGIPLNPANMIVLPLILGIGIDDGVHVVHDYLHTRGHYRLSRSTAMAVVLTSATTMVGFGSMMLARHQGLRSLGQVLTLGVFCCLVTTLVALPAMLAWMSRDTLPPGPTAGEPATPRPHTLRRPRRRTPRTVT